MHYSDIEKRAESGDYCFIYRDAIQNNWINRQHEINNSGCWMVQFLKDKCDQLQAYLCESLACALEHWDRQIATRCCFMAIGYIERLHAMGWAGGGRYEDAVRAAQARVERWISTEALEGLYNVSGLTFNQWWDHVRSNSNVPGMYRNSVKAIEAWRAGMLASEYAMTIVVALAK